MSRECRECKQDGLKVIGMGAYGDSIIVECPHCGAEYELDPDGLGEAGFELIEAFEIENQRRSEEKDYARID